LPSQKCATYTSKRKRKRKTREKRKEKKSIHSTHLLGAWLKFDNYIRAFLVPLTTYF
jgi:hypothetical protein